MSDQTPPADLLADLRTAAAEAAGLPASLAGRLLGSDLESLRADAEAFGLALGLKGTTPSGTGTLAAPAAPEAPTPCGRARSHDGRGC